ncbi:dephospho-CoA kinase [Devriesea agamarum]|uniref:dephospho-CoA kinase n=1 Tax=Devriesea agamarum TaxID=472569 RepID=UPI00071C3EFF|nr:dephospho-CoA kinase [Devriesea agamarum]
MHVVGLTGGIGSGKSTVASIWRGAGVPVLDLDAMSRAVLDAPGSPGAGLAIERFGSRIVAADGAIDRQALAAIVFADTRARADLEAIVLGRVDAEVRRQHALLQAEGARLVVHDNPLLLEKRRERDYELVVAVLARREDRLLRLVSERGRSREFYESVIAAQVSDLERVRRADVLVLNTGGRDVLMDRARCAWVRVCEQLNFH